MITAALLGLPAAHPGPVATPVRIKNGANYIAVRLARIEWRVPVTQPQMWTADGLGELEMPAYERWVETSPGTRSRPPVLIPSDD